MRILIHTPDSPSSSYSMGDEVRRALEVLNDALIKTEGGGTVTSRGVVTGVVMVSSEDDTSKALDALAEAGIKASRG